MVKMVVAEEIEVDLRQNIDTGILGIAIAEEEDGGIDDQETDDHRDGVLVVAEQGEERYDTVAESDTLHDSPDTEVAKAQKITLDGVVEPIDEKADGKQQHRALDDATDDFGGGCELGFHQRQVTGDTHDEEEEGKDEVAGGHAVPLGVFQHLEGLSPTVINQYHSCDSNAAENVET